MLLDEFAWFPAQRPATAGGSDVVTFPGRTCKPRVFRPALVHTRASDALSLQLAQQLLIQLGVD